jgi:hypothetical protein
MKYYIVYGYCTEPDRPEGDCEICFESFSHAEAANQRIYTLENEPRVKNLIGPLVLLSEVKS